MAERRIAPIYVGCSGWQYTGWRGVFYPEELPVERWLEFYSQSFRTVEVNNTFYHMPAREAVERWRDMVPPGFVFAVKANRLFTHRKKLQQVENSLHDFLQTVRLLGDHLGPILYQLPPRWRCNLERLASFLRQLPQGYMHAFEFRHPSWFAPVVRQLLAEHKAVFVVHDFPGLRVPRVSTGTAVYVRFHGPQPGYSGRYSRARLRRWARWLRSRARRGQTCFAYFNNDVNAAAVHNARYLCQLVSRTATVAPPPTKG